MMDYLLHITLLYSSVFTGVVVFINSTNPALLDSLKPLVLACLGLPGVTILFFTSFFVEEVVRVLRMRRIKQHGGWFTVIALPVFVISLLTIPTLVLELTVPGRGWLVWMFISGAVWHAGFFVFIRLHAKIRAILVPESKPQSGSRIESTSTKMKGSS